MDSIDISHTRGKRGSPPGPLRIMPLPSAMTHVRAARLMVAAFNSLALGSVLSVVESEAGSFQLVREPERRSFSPMPLNAARLRVAAATEWLRALRCGLLDETAIPAAVAADDAYRLVRSSRAYESLMETESCAGAAPRITIAADCDEVLLILAPTSGKSLAASHILRFACFDEASSALDELAAMRWCPFPGAAPPAG